MKKLFAAIFAAVLSASALQAQDISKDIVKKGLSFGPCPIVAFDNDKGFQLGALLNIYNFGDGSHYPVPKDQWYLEASFFTKGSQLFVVNYDNRTMIPGIRFNVAATFTNEKALDFFGFNGYDSGYDPDIAATSSPYYHMGRQVPYVKADFIGKFTEHLYWKAGYHFKYFNTFDYEPDGNHVATMFEDYRKDGVIPEDQWGGGFVSSVRAGLMYDSRDFEPSPSRGIWAEANIEGAPSWLGTSTPFVKYYFAFRHYLPIVGDKLVFAYRLNCQGFLKDPAFYVLPYETMLGTGYDRDGFGGYRTIRGIIRNRIQGRSVCYYNAELRYRFIDFHLFNQNISLALSAFCDGGRVLAPFAEAKLGALKDEKFHVAAGGGFRLIVNRNFIIAAEYGRAFNSLDCLPGKAGAFYVNTGFLF